MAESEKFSESSQALDTTRKAGRSGAAGSTGSAEAANRKSVAQRVPGTVRGAGKQNRRQRRLPNSRSSAKSNSKVLASTIFVSFLLLSSIALVYLVFRDNRSLNAILQEIDLLQSTGSEVAEIDYYRSAAKRAKTEIDYLRIFKRIYQIPVAKLRDQYLTDITAKAVASFPGNENLWAYRVSALLSQGQYLDAINGAEHLESSRYSALKGELLVRSMALARQNTSEDQAERSAAKSERQDWTIAEILKEAPHGAETYISLARLFQQPRFAWNAALIYMLNGRKDKALALVRELRGQEGLNTLAVGLIAYDNEDWQLAVELLEAERAKEMATQSLQTRTLQYLGDSYAMLGNYPKVIDVLSSASDLFDESLSILKKSKPVFPDNPKTGLEINSETDMDLAEASDNLGTWELYYNLASAYREIGDDLSAFEVLLQGRSVFSHNSELLLLMNIVAPPDEREYAKSILIELINKSSSDQPYLALASLIFEDRRVDQQKFTARLWNLFSKAPDNKQVLHYLLWYYLGLNHTEEAGLALERYRNLVLFKDDDSVADYPDWIKEYMAINDILQRNFAQAKELFDELVKSSPSWRLYYNFANISVYEADFPSAIRLLRKALDYTDKDEDKIDIYYRMMVLSQLADQNYLSASENDDLNNILQQYIADNYRSHGKPRPESEELMYIKLNTLVLWRKTHGSNLLDSPDNYRVEDPHQQGEFGESKENPQEGLLQLSDSDSGLITGYGLQTSNASHAGDTAILSAPIQQYSAETEAVQGVDN